MSSGTATVAEGGEWLAGGGYAGDIDAPPPDIVSPDTAPPRRFDPALALTAAAVLALYVVPKLLMHAGGFTADLDTGNYSHLAWAIGHGRGFASSVLGRHHLGEHFSPIMALFAPIYLVWASAYVLMVAQGAAVALAVVLVQAWLGRRLESAGLTADRIGRGAAGWRFGAGAVVLVLSVSYPALTAAWQTQFQPIVLGMPMVVASMWLMHGRVGGGGIDDGIERPASGRRTVALALVVALLLTTRESAPLAVAGLAIYAGVGLGRWRLALALGVVAGAWAGVVMGVLMPWFRAGADWRHAAYFGPLRQWDGSDGKLFYLLVLVGGLGFLPVMGRRATAAALGAVPGVCLNLATDRPSQFGFANHYDAQNVGFLLVAAMWGAVWLTPRLAALPSPRRFVVGGVVAAGVVAAGVALHDIAGTQTPFEAAARWWPTPARRATVAAAARVDAEFPDVPAVTAHGYLGPRLCHRPHYMAMRMKDWRHFAITKLLPGELIVLPGEASPLYTAWLVRAAETDGRTQTVRVTPWVRVYRYPPNAPTVNTGLRLKYVKRGLTRVAEAAAAEGGE